jgi:hypothetical protein
MTTLPRTAAALLLATISAGGALADGPAAAAGPVAKGARPAAAATTHHRHAPPPFRAVVDMPTFMEHVLTPAATVVWRTNGFVNDAAGEHDLAPKTDADWELVVSGAATLAEASNALMIPQRAPDPEWTGYVQRLLDIAERAYQAAEKHDLHTLSDVSDHLDAVCSACHQHYGLE